MRTRDVRAELNSVAQFSVAGRRLISKEAAMEFRDRDRSAHRAEPTFGTS